MAPRPAMVIVRAAIKRRTGLNHGARLRRGKNRMATKTPAVTSVEEWTKADTGVGAAMAAGSHLENGICALFVMAANMIERVSILLNPEGHMLRINQCPWFSVHPILRRRQTSPIRLVSAVIIPAPNLFGFW